MFANSNKPALSKDQVLHMRDLYYNHYYSYPKLAKQFNVSSALARKAVQGLNGYKNIEDNIPEEVKQSRKPARETYAWHRIAAKNQFPHT